MDLGYCAKKSKATVLQACRQSRRHYVSHFILPQIDPLSRTFLPQFISRFSPVGSSALPTPSNINKAKDS